MVYLSISCCNAQPSLIHKSPQCMQLNSTAKFADARRRALKLRQEQEKKVNFNPITNFPHVPIPDFGVSLPPPVAAVTVAPQTNALGSIMNNMNGDVCITDFVSPRCYHTVSSRNHNNNNNHLKDEMYAPGDAMSFDENYNPFAGY
eukprot:596752_1